MSAELDEATIVDPDPEHLAGSTVPSARTLRARGSALGFVFVGGTLGTFLRYALSVIFPASLWRIPIATLSINVTGAFLLGLLLEATVAGHPDTGVRRAARLAGGTGLLGGFTTYSTFAVGTDGLLETGHVWPAVLYAVITVTVGAAASLAGILLGGSLRTGARR